MESNHEEQKRQLELKSEELGELSEQKENVELRLQKLNEITQELNAYVKSKNEKLKTCKAEIRELKRQAGQQQIEDSDDESENEL